MASRAILSNFFEKQWTQNHPQYLSGLLRALFPTTFLEIAVYSQSESLRDETASQYRYFHFKKVLNSAVTESER